MPPEPEHGDDIEILEVVGVDEDGAPLPEDASDDVEVLFEETEVDRAPLPPPSVEDAGLKERLVRLQADFENHKKRIDRERSDYARHATGGLVARLLPVLDNLERALASRSRSSGADPLFDGVALIQRQLLEELSLEGLRPMDPIGAAFDPELHEAVATDTSSSSPPNTVTAVLQRGYFFHDRVLRAALVRVSVDDGSGNGATPSREES